MAHQSGGGRSASSDGPATQNASLQRLQDVEKRVVRVLELAGGVMDELANSTGPRVEVLNGQCREFMRSIKLTEVGIMIWASHGWSARRVRRGYRHGISSNYNFIQETLREEIKSACEYRPFEKCDYNARISNDICCKKLEYVIEQLDSMKQSVDQCKDA